MAERVPLVRQLTVTDCGPAALAMVLGFFGRRMPLADLRKILHAGRDGVDAAAIVQAARIYGLRGRGVRLEVEDLDQLPMGAILYWRFRHFVVFERLHKKHVHIVDPAVGYRTVPISEFRQCFTGVALVLEPSESFERGGNKKKRISRWVFQILECRGLLTRIVTSSILAQTAGVMVPLLTGLVIDRVVPHSDMPLLFELFLGYCLFQIFSVLATFVRAHLFIYLKTQLETTFTLRFLDHLIDLPYSFFQEHSTGDLMVRLGSNDVIRDLLTSAALSTVLDGAMASLYCMLLFLVSVKLALFALILASTRFVLLTVMRWRQKILLSENLENQSNVQTYQVEMLAGMETLKAMGLESRAAERWTNLFIEGLNISIRRGRLDAAFEGVVSLLGSATTLTFLFYATYMVLQKELTVGTMVAVSALAAGLLSPLNNLIGTLLQLQIVEVYLDRLNDVLETPPEQNLQTVSIPEEMEGDVAVEKVNFRYTDQGPLVLQDVSFSVPRGSRVALVGPSGCGKSTLVRLIAGLYNPSDGKILYDGRNLHLLERRSVRSRIGVVTQDTQLFGGSIRLNIALSDPEMELGRVIQAANDACIHDDIAQMPMGYDTVLTDRGLSLSGGQRQRLALARALANNPVLLILDEATSHLDAVTEERVNRSLASLKCTRIVVAHRLSTIRDADLIVVLDGGHLVESGRHEELLELGGIYSALTAAQRDRITQSSFSVH
ncbi:peptidase domain-containing ABC transporter [Tunturiibacter psychrotolerans]|uniref:peptidase domain-containing ABC transporter n=1 Tax=Tunturiibacter psychrotolerans TaxID=3069686 RepID=UPI003D1B316A